MGVAPKLIICKARGATGNWATYHASLGAGYAMFLDLTDAQASTTAAWNNTSPTSSVFSIAASANTNPSSTTVVAYCWAEISGFSKFGNYTANASTDGVFIYTGFRPKYVLFKKSSGTSDWMVFDSSRDTYNPEQKFLLPNSNTTAETSTQPRCDFLSNGIKIRAPSGYTPNETNGDVYIYAAFAETPFKNALAR